MFANDPFIGGDMDVLKDLDEQILASMGIKLNIKETDELKFMNIVNQLMRTPNWQKNITLAVQQSAQELAQMGAMQGAEQGKGGPPPQNGNGRGANVQAV